MCYQCGGASELRKQNEEMITISKKGYDSLVEDSAKLRKLENDGINNWDCCWGEIK